LDLLLADFQGVLQSPTGETLLDGLARESTKAYLPRDGGSSVTSVKTDIFALGCTIYSLMTGHEVFPDLDHFEDEEEIESRFRDGLFPTDSQPCFAITEKCWNQQYLSADEILHDLSLVGAVKSHVE
jgi:serine/threonine protein kinase